MGEQRYTMLLECKNCGAPLDVKGTPDVVRCDYCGASAAMAHLRTLNQQTPGGWKRPEQWRPPAHVPADSGRTYRYAGAQRWGLVFGVGAAGLAVAGAVSFMALAQGRNSSALPDDGTCPSSFTAVSGDSHECRCGSNVPRGSVWGSGIYTADSSICRAARHAGAIGASGGAVVVRAAVGCLAYSGSRRNGIQTSVWGQYQRSFYFQGHGDGSCGGGSAKPVPPTACPARFQAPSVRGTGELRCKCAPAQFSGTVWGSQIYTADSLLCNAALHAGAVARSGGEVRARRAAGCASYSGSSKHGVTSNDWGKFTRSFYFVGHGSGACR